MTENAAETTEVSVEQPAKTTTEVTVDSTPEVNDATTAAPDAVTESLEAEPKEQPSE